MAFFSTKTSDADEFFWRKIVSGNYFFTDINELFLTRVIAFKNLASEDATRSEKAKLFLLATMTPSKREYDSPTKQAFVRSVKSWGDPEILASRCDNALSAIVYKIKCQVGDTEKTLHEIAFFTKSADGSYNYSHQYDLNKLHADYCRAPNTDQRIRQIGDPVLHQEAQTIVDFTDKKILEQLQILTATLTATGGAGIAANQCALIDKPLKIILTGVDYLNPEHVVKAITRYPRTLFPQMRVYLNPEIVMMSKQTEVFSEGCLSAQGRFRAKVLRSANLTVRYHDMNGCTHEENLSGSDARAMLHELDHILNGKVYIQRIFDELNSEQRQTLFAIIARALSLEKNTTTSNPFLEPVTLFERAEDGSITFDEETVSAIFKDTNESVLIGLHEYLEQKIRMDQRQRHV